MPFDKNRTGNRVNLNPNDGNPSTGNTGVQAIDDMRLDLPDAAAVTETLMETMVRTLGGILGFTSGWLTKPTMTVVATDVTIGNGLLYDGLTDAGSFVGRVLRYESTLSHQAAATVALAPYSPATPAVIWARRIEVETAQDVRRKWSTSSAAEATFSPLTRRSEAVEFITSPAVATAPVVGSGEESYFPCAHVTWAAGVPTVTPIVAWDGMENSNSASWPTAILDVIKYPGNTVYGLTDMLARVRLQIARIVDTTLSSTWQSSPSRGLAQVATALTSLEAHPDNVNLPSTPPFQRAHGIALWLGTTTPSSYTFLGVGITSITRISTGVVEVTVTATAVNTASGTVIMATPVEEGNDPANPCWCRIESNSMPAGGGGAGTFRVACYDNLTGVPADHSFHFIVMDSKA